MFTPTPLTPIQQLHPTRPPTPTQPMSGIPVPSALLSQRPIKQLQPTQTLALPQPVSLPPISTLLEEDEPEPEKQEPESEQQSELLLKWVSDSERDEFDRIIIQNLNESILK